MIISATLTYWAVTTIIGVYCMIKYPSLRRGDDLEYITVLDVLGMILPSALLAWFLLPMLILNRIKFKRKK